MKLYLIIVLFLVFASLSFGQTPSASPEKVKVFGSSLKKYVKKEQEYFHPDQKSRESDDSETIRVKTDLVVNDVLVTDLSGRIIADLHKDDFVVTEDGTPQKIEMFSSGENASGSRSIVLIIDYSLSQLPYIKNSVEAAKILVDKLNPNDKMAIATDDVKLLVDFTTNKTLLKKTLDSLVKKTLQISDSGKSNQFSALLAVLNEMFNEKSGRPTIIFQTDGDEISTLKIDNDTPYKVSKTIRKKSRVEYEKERDFGFSDIKEAIEKSQATIYSVIPGIRFLGLSKEEQLERGKISLENQYRSHGIKNELRLAYEANKYKAEEAERELTAQIAMFKVAELSGGKTGFIEKPDDAENVYSSIFKQISNRYSIGYYPTNEVKDGKLREVKVEVRNHPEYIVTGRKAYLPNQ